MDIKRVIKEKGLTSKEVADRMGITPIGLSQHINGNPTLQVLEKIASAIGCEVVEFFNDNSDISTYQDNDNKTPKKDFTLKILELCKQKGLTQVALAEKMGISRVGLAKALGGNTTITTLEKAAAALGVEVWDLFYKGTDFTAYIDDCGELRKFTDIHRLYMYLGERIGEKQKNSEN